MALEAVLRRAHLFLYAIMAICCVIEAALSLGDLGVIGPARLRQLAYDYGGFWPGLLDDWQPNYTAQPYAMFLSYGFLHGGPAHLAVNMITLWSLGRAVIDRVGQGGFALLYAGAILGGGAGFALLASGLRPMVGASGALFGLVGGILAWAYVDRYTYREGLWPVARAVLLLAGLNLVLWWAMKGQLAWETHLGGFLAGWVVALLIDPRPQTEG
ncbi:MAG: rhomboid family intramembrane serine protease [Rhodovulum sp.]